MGSGFAAEGAQAGEQAGAGCTARYHAKGAAKEHGMPLQGCMAP